MKLVVVLAVLCCLALGALASPVRQESASDSASPITAKVAGRQAPATPVAADEEDEDDDDDDDDDPLDIGLDEVDEDDDDDEDDEDDDEDDEEDEGDYVERFIEDIFGGEDDDDDDDEDETPAANPVAQVLSSPVNPIVQSAQPVIPPNVAEDLEAAVQDAGGVDPEGGEYVEEPAEEQAASSVVEASEEGAESVPLVGVEQSVAPSAVVAEVANAENADNDDDDDDDDDDEDESVDLGIPGVDEEDDDDDDSDDATGDDDDDDDEDDVDDEFSELTEARRARAMSSTSNNHVPAVYIAKYNKFVDNILGRINKILRTNYNPVTVKLTSANAKTKANKKKIKGKGKKDTKNAAKKNEPKSNDKSASATIGNNLGDRNNSLVNNNVDLVSQPKIEEIKNPAEVEATTINTIPLSTTLKNVESGRATANTNKKTNKRKSTTKKNKTKATKSKPKARATLYGLSSLERVGDVSVNMKSDHTTVRTKFSVGPLTLRVEREFARSGKKELRSATATTAEMSGKLNLRVLHGGAATLHSIRVLQPKQVRVESADDHDRTREFVWKRSSHIAHVVSQKLSSATKSMLRPPPVAVQTA